MSQHLHDKFLKKNIKYIILKNKYSKLYFLSFASLPYIPISVKFDENRVS